MKSTSSGSGLRSVRAIASTPRSATSRRRISASIISFRTLQPAFEVLAREPLVERALADLLVSWACAIILVTRPSASSCRSVR